MLVQEIYGMGLNPRPKKERKPKLRKLWYSGKCRKCGKPKKPQYPTARNLTRLETDTCTDTAQNKRDFDIERKYSYCNPYSCRRNPAEPTHYTNFMDLAEAYYGTRDLTRRQKREYSKILAAEIAEIENAI